MKENPDDNYTYNEPEQPKKTYKKRDKNEPLLKPWWTTLKPEKIVDHIPIMTHAKKGLHNRVQLPVHESTQVIATMIREKHPDKFKIELDVYKSMLYAGRQLFEYIFIENNPAVKKCKMQKLATYLHEFEVLSYWETWLENHLEKLAERYINCDINHFSGTNFDDFREQIIQKVTKVKELLPEQLHKRCDNFLEEDINSEAIKERIRERLRKRDYRERKKNLNLVVSHEQ